MPSSRSSFDNHHHRNPTSTTTNFSAPPRHHQPFDSPPPNYNNNNNNQRPTTTGFSGPPGQQQPRHHQPFDSPPPNYNPNNNNNNNNNNQRPTTGLSGPPPSQQPPRHHQPFDSQRPTTTGFSGPPGQQQPRHHQPFDSPPPNYPVGGGGRGGFRPMGGGGRGFGGDFGMAHAGQKRGHPFSARAGGGSSPDGGDGGSFAKLFVGSVPKTAVEEEIRPLFEEHGEVIEVALLKDKRTGLQQGCCFIKYATSEEADRAIGALHNKYTLPGGVGPIQVRYADGERERLGAVEHKLFVGSLNRQATEKEIEEIFSPYGRVEDVYIMRDEVKQSRGCGFVKFSHREMAAAAIAALSGIYVMRGCEQPLTVRFADPKRPRGAESRGGPAFGGPGSGPRSQAFSGVRPPPYLGDPMGGHPPPNAWHPMSSQNVVQSPQANNTHGFGSHLTTKGGIVPALSAMGGAMGGPTNGSHAGPTFPSSSLPQTSDPSMSQASSIGQQVSPMLKLNQSTQHFLPPYQLHSQQMGVSYSQKDTPPVSIHQMGMLQNSSSTSQSSSSQAMPSQQIFNLSGQLPVSQSHVQQTASSAAAQFVPPNFQRHGMSSTASQQLSAPASQQHLLQPLQQSPTQLAQVLSQQTQALQASFQSSQQAFSQLQQQLHLIQKSTQSPSQQQASQVNKQQDPGYTQSQPVGSLGVDPARFQQGPQATQEWMWKNKPAVSAAIPYPFEIPGSHNFTAILLVCGDHEVEDLHLPHHAGGKLSRIPGTGVGRLQLKRRASKNVHPGISNESSKEGDAL
ncbi:hypothetical protein IFM89_034278 [Coptis chinensis]|uniref:Flowering time control protein FCA n=1 Tax=Coptis chinensis TaxID=261450 RepID=A0A835IRM3_9MAGN|nr:hypothetical protein IFM89_034278 [Coptis chinensis]